MNVSSVKNLNGETFSAVQDATLTDVVQTNSGNWQDITAYQNNSGTYLTAVDLSPYYTTADANTLSSMLSGAIDYVSANAGKVYEGVSPIVVNNTEDKISADTWTFSAGSNVSFVDDNVNKITRIDCTVTGYNETVLFDNYGNNTDLQLSESPLNFSNIELYCRGSQINGNNEAWGSMKLDCEQLSSTNYVMVNGGFCGICSSPTTGNCYVMYALYTGCSGTNWKKTFGMATRGSYIDAANSGHFFIYKVVGINRKY